MNLRKFLAMFFVGGALLLTSCSDDDDSTPVNDEELITTMLVTLTDGTDTVTLRFYDEDGADGPTEPVPTVSGGPLKASTTYAGSISVLNESEDPAENVNEEIEGEADEHQFFYVTNDLGITTAYTDQECDYNEDPCEGSNARPVGLTFTLTTTEDTGAGKLRVVLRHEPNKDATGVSTGDITNAGGDPDIDWTFDIGVE